MIIALSTFLLGVWVMVVGIRKPVVVQSSPTLTNDVSAWEALR